MSRMSDAVKRWRENTKDRIVKSMGGKCIICGYDKCSDALDLHHINPSEKEISFGGIRASPRSWKKIVVELRKCVLLCANHHREVHNGIAKIPDTYNGFDESFVEYKHDSNEDVTHCSICGKLKPKRSITCSKQCASRKARKVDWDKIDLIKLIQEGMSKVAIGDMLGVSDMAVRKRLKKISSLSENGQNVTG